MQNKERGSQEHNRQPTANTSTYQVPVKACLYGEGTECHGHSWSFRFSRGGNREREMDVEGCCVEECHQEGSMMSFMLVSLHGPSLTSRKG